MGRNAVREFRDSSVEFRVCLRIHRPEHPLLVTCSTNLSRNEALQSLFSHKVNADASRNPIIRVTWSPRLAQGRRPFGMGRFGHRR
jgi:hypothetical protein